MNNYIQYKGEVYRVKHIDNNGRYKSFKKLSTMIQNKKLGYPMPYVVLDGVYTNKHKALHLLREVSDNEFQKLKNA